MNSGNRSHRSAPHLLQGGTSPAAGTGNREGHKGVSSPSKQ